MQVDTQSIAYSLFSTPGGDETLQDEALESRIAALNLLDLNLSHLGIIVEDESDVDDINMVVKDAGLQLQLLNSIPDAKSKLEGLVKTHQIIVGKYSLCFFDYTKIADKRYRGNWRICGKVSTS